MFYFSKEDIIYLHKKLVIKFGGEDGIRDEGILDLAINNPLQTFDYKDLYPSTIEKITRLSFGLVMDHPFIDGNKRIGAKVLDVGLCANGYVLKATNKDLIKTFLKLASSNMSYLEFLEWVKSKVL